MSLNIYSLGLFKLLGFLCAFGFELGSPQLSLGVGLAELSLEVGSAFLFFLELFAESIEISLKVAELRGEFLASLLKEKGSFYFLSVCC